MGTWGQRCGGRKEMRRGGTRGFLWTTEQDGNTEQGKRRRTVSGRGERGMGRRDGKGS